MRLGIKALVLACVCGWMIAAPAKAQEAGSLEDLLKDIEPAPAASAETVESAVAAEEPLAEVVAPESEMPAVEEAFPAEAEPTAESLAEPAIEPEVTDVIIEEVTEEAVAVEPALVEEIAVEPAVEAGIAEEFAAQPEAAEEPVAGAEEGIETFVPGEESVVGTEVTEEPVAAVEEPSAAVEEPVVDVEAPIAAVEEPVAAVEEPAAAVEEPAPVAPIWEEAPAATEEPTILSEPAAVWEGEAVTPAEMEAEPAAVEAEVEAAPEVEAEPSIEKPAKKKISAKEARQIAEQEEVKRQALQIDGERQLQIGYTALQAKDYAAATTAFETTLDKLPDRPQNVALRERARWGKAEAYYQIAADQIRKDNLKASRENVEKALRAVPEHRPAAVLLKRIEKEEARALLPVAPAKRPEVVERTKTIAELLGEARQYFDLEDYNEAERLYEQVLLQDEYNIEAMRYLRRLDERRFKLRTLERNATSADMMQQVRDTWNPPVRDDMGGPERILGRETMVDKTATQKLQEKLSKIIIPSLEVRDANIHDVIKNLDEMARANDPDGFGVNILLNLNVPGSEGGEAAPAAPSAPASAAGGFDEFDEFFQEPAMAAAPAAAPAARVRTITLNLRRVSLLDAIKYITDVANLKYRIEDNVVIITPAGVVWGRVITRMYPVQPSILDVIVEKDETETAARTSDFIEMGGGRPTIKGRGDVKDFFEKAGVPFPAGTSITYNPTISQLIVANTAENLDTFERILAQLNVIPTQVEIEARFVEVNQSDLEELGLQWILTDNWEIAQRQGIAPIAGQERVQINADKNGFTKGLRFFGFDGATGAIDPTSAATRGTATPLGGILTAASVLTNPELTVILQALSQSGHSDLLSAPRITTRSGVNAQIQVVKEIIYPTEFEVSEPILSQGGEVLSPPMVTPGAFQTREVGVILNVTPTVGPDGYTIDITMVPEVAELVDWIQYGSEISISSGATETTTATDRTFRFNIPQPIFSSRNVTTSLVIWDGQTVVMGGLIREELVTMKDKIPFLGDIPIIGRLFRSEGQKSRKTNLLIFVTARLVDPAGKPVHKAETRAMPGGGVQTGEGTTATP